MKDASNVGECEEDECIEQRKTVHVLPSCFPCVETTLNTSALGARMEREKEKNGALEVTSQEAVAAQMYLEARLQLERRVRDELAELREQNEGARDALEAGEEREKKNTTELHVRMQEAEEYSQLMRQVAMDSQSRWRSELEERTRNSYGQELRWMLEADAARTAAESRVEGLEAMVQRERAERLAIQSRCSSELEERMEKAEEDTVALEVAMITKTRSIARLGDERLRAAAAESRVEGLEAMVQRERAEMLAIQSRCSRELEERMQEAEEAERTQEAEGVLLRVERLEAMVQLRRSESRVERLEARVQQRELTYEAKLRTRELREDRLHEEVLHRDFWVEDRENDLTLAKELLETTESELIQTAEALELLEVERSSLDGECCICQVRPVMCAMVPCGHWCVCDTCGRRAHQGRREERTCPLCRGQVDRVVRIFRSASSRTEMATEDEARGSGAVPDEDWWRSSRAW